MKIKSKDMILRYFQKKDFNDFHKCRNDKEIGRNMFRGTYPLTKKQAKKDFDHHLKSNKQKNIDAFAITVNNEIVGAISLSEILPKLKAKIGYWIAKDYRNKGYATKSVKLICNYGFKKYKLKRIYGNIRTFNKSSVKVLEKAGFKKEGIMKKNFTKKGKYYDDYLYAKTK